MSTLDPTHDYKDLAERALEELGEGVFSKATILSAIHKPINQYWWCRFRRGMSQYGASLKEISPKSGDWQIKMIAKDVGGIIEERQDLHEEWNKNLDGDIQALLDSIAIDPEELMIKVVDRGYDPFKVLYLAAANGTSESQIERMANVLAAPDVRAFIAPSSIDRHNKIMGLLEPS